MTGARALGVALVIAVSGGGAAAKQPVELHRLFPKQAKITVEQDGLVRLPLSAEVLAACRPDLSDLKWCPLVVHAHILVTSGNGVFWVDGQHQLGRSIQRH